MSASDSTLVGGTYPEDATREINIPSTSGFSGSGIPANARGYAITVTALPNGNSLPFLTAYPACQARPNASILNVPAGSNGSITIYAYRRTDVVVDVTGTSGGSILLWANCH